jgi:hypothetical protein
MICALLLCREVLKSVFWVTVITCFFSAVFVYAYVRLPQWSPTYGNFIFVAALLLFVSLFATVSHFYCLLAAHSNLLIR